MSNLTQASHQWATRPDDERFTSLHEMSASLNLIKARSRATVVSSRSGIHCEPISDTDLKGLQIVGPNGHPYQPTHWSFGQLSQLAGAPAGYLRTLPAAIVADNINYGLRFNRAPEDVGVLLRRTPVENVNNVADAHTYDLTAATGPQYGRIWNADITDALIAKFGDGVTGDWRVPGEFGQQIEVTKANTTLYASDRDMFVFLADEDHRVAVANRRDGKPGTLARGFFLWNSETGGTSIGAAFFLFDYACCNRIVWGAQGYKEIRLRHTKSAPDRWLAEISPVLIEYANSAAAPVEATIRAAQAHKLDEAQAWLAKRYSVRQAAQYNAAHERDENRPIETLWDAVTGMTAYARTVPHQDQRVAIEREAGKLLNAFA